MEKTPETRTPAEVQADIQKLHSEASKLFVPMNIQRGMELQLEFNASVVAFLDAVEQELAALKS